jgi:hypothetical protein
MVGCLAMVNLRHTWRLNGKIPSTFQVRHSRPTLSALSPQLTCRLKAPCRPLNPG